MIIHCDYELNIGKENTTGPSITITECYEAIEAPTLNIHLGDIDINSVDDCLNAANSDLKNYDFSMTISNGTINAYSSSGDGFDSNGSLTISGGSVTVWTASIADNQPFDADDSITISGGTVMAAGGSAGMGMNLNATQSYIIFGTGSGMGHDPQSSGTSVSVSKNGTLSVRDSSENTVFSETAPCNVNYVLFSSGELTSDNSYTLYSDSTSAAAATAQTGSTGGRTHGSNGDMPHGRPGQDSDDVNGAPSAPPSGSDTPPSAPDKNPPDGIPGAAEGTPPAAFTEEIN